MKQNNLPASDISRRSFLRTTSTAVVGGGLLGSLAIDKSAFAAGDDTLKIALIGCGGRGSGAANQALSTSGGVKLVAMADAFKDRLEGSLQNLKGQHKDKVAVSDDAKFVGFDAYKQAIAMADVVILATPPGFRPIHFEEAVRQGKHIFMEKPVATDAPGVRRVLAAAEEAKKKNLKVGVGLQRHHQLVYLETMQRLHDGIIGDIVSMRAYWNDSGVWVKPRQPNQTEMDYQMRNWYYFPWIGGDHIVEQHIHNIDVINWVKRGHPVRAQGMGGRQVRTGKEYGQIFDHHFVEFEYADGSRLYSQCRHIPGCWSSVSEHVQGTKGSCDVGGGIVRGENAWRWKRPEQPKDPYQQEHDDLFAAIRNNTPYNEVENGAHSTMTAILGRMCTYSGKMIEWDDAINSKLDLMPERYAWDAMPKVLPNAEGWYPVPIPGNEKSISNVI
jgi:myo-inositol 2-dehydrogenase/D-chiro-inositol 1-dehydrogenase